ncbi:MAG: HAD-IIA family hydrolase, partial [Candidatus Aminicenantales bacterium]
LKDKNLRDLYVVGTASMRQMFEGAGLETDSPSPDCVVVGFDTELTYEKLRKAALLIQNGVEYIVTHPDLVCPTPEGFIPDAGSFVALLEKATGEKPSRIFGKPHREMVSHILKKHGVAPEEVVMIGDRIYTDMELARQIPCDFILVLTGETKREDLARLPTPPDLVVSRIGDILS